MLPIDWAGVSACGSWLFFVTCSIAILLKMDFFLLYTDFPLSSSDLQNLANFNSPAAVISGQWPGQGPLTAAIQAAGLDPMVSV